MARRKRLAKLQVYPFRHKGKVRYQWRMVGANHEKMAMGANGTGYASRDGANRAWRRVARVFNALVGLTLVEHLDESGAVTRSYFW